MNLILFDESFDRIRLEGTDPRALHLRKVVGVEAGSKVFIGFAGGPRARAEVEALEPDGALELVVAAREPAPPPLPLVLLLGLPRPHTARRMLAEAASIGVSALHFFESERGEPSYARSSLWRGDEWRERLRTGAEQGFTTHLPEVAMHADLQSAISHLPHDGPRVALDNYEADGELSGLLDPAAPRALLALGPERGWSGAEREVFRRNGWRLGHLGAQVLRAESALVAAAAVTASRMGWWREQTKTGI